MHKDSCYSNVMINLRIGERGNCVPFFSLSDSASNGFGALLSSVFRMTDNPYVIYHVISLEPTEMNTVEEKYL